MVYIEKTYTDNGVSGECRFDGWGADSSFTVDVACWEQTVCRCRGNSLQPVACSLSCVRLQCDFRGGQTLFDVALEFPCGVFTYGLLVRLRCGVGRSVAVPRGSLCEYTQPCNLSILQCSGLRPAQKIHAYVFGRI